MTITVDVATENVRTGTGSPTTFSHAADASGVVGVVIGFMHGASTTNHFSSVTYGGAALTEIITATDSATEPGFSSLWFLGSGLSGLQGTQTVSYASGATTDDVLCVCITLKAGTNVTSLQVASTGSVNTNTNGPSVALTTGSREGMGFAAYYFGGGTAPTAGANCTAIGSGSQLDGTAYSARMIRQTTGGTANFTIAGVGNDDTAFSAMMVVEAGPVLPATDSEAFTGYAPTISVTEPEAPKTALPSTGASTLTGFAPAVIMGFVAATGAGSLSVQETGWVSPKIETAVNTGGGDGGLLLGLNGLLSATQNYTVNPTTGAISVTGQTPTRLVDSPVTPSAGSLVLAGETPTRLVDSPVNPSAGGLSLAGETPTRLVDSPVTPSVGSVGVTGQTPTLLVDSPVTPSVGSLGLTGQTPVALVDSPVTPSVGSLAFTGYQPSVNGAGAITPSAGDLAFTGYQPSIVGATTISPSAGALSFTGYEPTALEARLVSPDVGSLALTGYAPSALVPRTISPSAGAVSVTGSAPSISVGSAGGGGYGGLLVGLNLAFDPPSTRSPTQGNLALTGYAPTLSITSGSSGTGLLMALGTLTEPVALSGLYQPQAGAVSFTGYAPTAIRSATDVGWDELVAGNATVAGTGDRNAIYDPKLAHPLTGSLAFTGYAPTARVEITQSPSVGSVAFTGHAPEALVSLTVFPSSGTVTIATQSGLGYGLLDYGRYAYGTPRIGSINAQVGPLTGTYAVIGYRPTVTQQLLVLPSTGSLSLTGLAPNIPQFVSPLSGSVELTGWAIATDITNPIREPSTGSIGLTGYSVTLQYNIAALPSILRGGRAFIEVYQDTDVSVDLVAGNATISSSIGQMSYGSGDLIAGSAAVSTRNWVDQAPATNGWSQQSDASDIWTEVTPNTDTWNG